MTGVIIVIAVIVGGWIFFGKQIKRMFSKKLDKKQEEDGGIKEDGNNGIEDVATSKPVTKIKVVNTFPFFKIEKDVPPLGEQKDTKKEGDTQDKKDNKTGEGEDSNKGKDGEGDKKKEVVYKAVNAYVYNDMIGRCGPMVMPADEVGKIIEKYGSLGRPRNRGGKSLYHFNHDEEGYHPTYFPWSPTNSSKRLHRAMQHPEIAIIYDVEAERGKLQRYGMYFIFAGVVIFMMWTGVMG